MTFPRLLLGIVLPLYILDQITKFWIVARFSEPPPGYFSSGEEIPVIEGFFNIVRVHNQGVAFGFGNGTDWAPIVFLIVPVIALTLITIGWRTNFFEGRMGKIAVALLLTGILGNLTDRLIQGSRLSYMAGEPLDDFLDVTIPVINYRWPSFNVADSCICIAAGLLFISGLRADLKNKEKPADV